MAELTRGRLRRLLAGRRRDPRHAQVLHRALQYASTFGYTVWLRPQDAWLGNGVAAKGPLATRLGLSGVPVARRDDRAATIFELVRDDRCARPPVPAEQRRGRRAACGGAKAEGLPVTCDVSINSLHLIDLDIGYFDAAMRLVPPLRQQRDRDALRSGLADGTIDALVQRSHAGRGGREEPAVRRGRTGRDRARAAARPGAQVGPGEQARPGAHARRASRAGPRPCSRARPAAGAAPAAGLSRRRRRRPVRVRSRRVVDRDADDARAASSHHTPFRATRCPAGCAARSSPAALAFDAAG